jgi:hypothetical protein
VTEVVRGHLALESLRGEQVWPAHDAGVADHGGERVVALEQRPSAVRDRVGAGHDEGASVLGAELLCIGSASRGAYGRAVSAVRIA